MKYAILLLFAITIFSCENHLFNSDKRQLTAKNEIRGKLGNIQSYDITDFKEDTLAEWPGTAFKNPIRYSLNIAYKDSTGILQTKKGFVVFTPDGTSVIGSEIIN